MTALGTVRRYIDALNSHDPERIVDCVTPEFRSNHASARGSSFVGRAEYSNRLRRFLAKFPDVRYEIVNAIEEDDQVAVTYRMTGRYAAVQAEPSFDIRGVFWFVVANGRVVERTDFRDGVTFEQQVGLRPGGDPKLSSGAPST